MKGSGILKFWYNLMAANFIMMLLFASGVDGPAWGLNLCLAAISLGIMYLCQKKIEKLEESAGE